MMRRRILWIAIGVLIAGGAALVILRGLAGARQAGVAGGQTAATEEAQNTDAERIGSTRWGDYAGLGSVDRGAGDSEAPERPIVPLGARPSDPFARSATGVPPARAALRLEGIAPGDDAMALISGRVVRIGDVVDGLRVTAIDRSGVSLSGPGPRRLELSARPGRAAAP